MGQLMNQADRARPGCPAANITHHERYVPAAAEFDGEREFPAGTTCGGLGAYAIRDEDLREVETAPVHGPGLGLLGWIQEPSRGRQDDAGFAERQGTRRLLHHGNERVNARGRGRGAWRLPQQPAEIDLDAAIELAIVLSALR